jgi:MFS family permease
LDAVWWLAALLTLAPLVLLRGDVSVVRAPGVGGGHVRAALLPALALALTNFAHAGVVAFLVLHLGERGVAHASVVLTAIGASLVASRLLLAGLPDRLGGGPVAAAAALAYAAGVVVMTVASSLPAALAGAALAGGGLALQFPALALVVVQRVPAGRAGAALGVYSTGFEVGTIVGGPALGGVAALAGYGPTLLVAAAAGVASALVAAVCATRLSPDRAIERVPGGITMSNDVERG